MPQPAIQAAKNLTLKAVYSRSLKSAQSIADLEPGPVDLYSDDSDKGFKDLLRRDDIVGVIVS